MGQGHFQGLCPLGSPQKKCLPLLLSAELLTHGLKCPDLSPACFLPTAPGAPPPRLLLLYLSHLGFLQFFALHTQGFHHNGLDHHWDCPLWARPQTGLGNLRGVLPLRENPFVFPSTPVSLQTAVDNPAVLTTWSLAFHSILAVWAMPPVLAAPGALPLRLHLSCILSPPNL
jgi:hypothetical protein